MSEIIKMLKFLWRETEPIGRVFLIIYAIIFAAIVVEMFKILLSGG